MTGGTINPTGAITSGVVFPMTLNFGAAGAGEAIIYNSGTAIIQAQINATQASPNSVLASFRSTASILALELRSSFMKLSPTFVCLIL